MKCTRPVCLRGKKEKKRKLNNRAELRLQPPPKKNKAAPQKNDKEEKKENMKNMSSFKLFVYIYTCCKMKNETMGVRRW